MKFGYILEIQNISEKALKLSILSDCGLISYYVSSYQAKKNNINILSFINYDLNNKNFINIQSLNQINIDIYRSKQKLQLVLYFLRIIINISTFLLNDCNACKILQEFLKNIQTAQNCEIIYYYIQAQIKILKTIGYGLSLDKCVVTSSSHDLVYISPKSLCAVSKEAGQKYKDKLFLYPKCLMNITNDFLSEITDQDITIGMSIINKAWERVEEPSQKIDYITNLNKNILSIMMPYVKI